MQKLSLISFDIEDWHQVENLRNGIKQLSKPPAYSNVEKKTNEILSICQKHAVNATFFILGSVARRYPDLVRKIVDKGHEIASHGLGHDLTYNLARSDLREDIKKSKNILEQITGQMVWGYRAPNFSVSDELIHILIDLGFVYDASYNPFRLNNRYGSVNLPKEKVDNIFLIDEKIYEIPISALEIGKLRIPVGGGAYFRVAPFSLFKLLIKKELKASKYYSFYLHPWELDSGQPRIKKIPLNYRFRHYYGLANTAGKLNKLFNFLKAADCRFMTMNDYISNVKQEKKIISNSG